MKHKATYLLIKSSVLSVTGETKPEEPEKLTLHDHHFEFTVSYRKKWIAYDQAMKAFNESFIKVDNPVALTDWSFTNPLSIKEQVHGVWVTKDGLYPAPDGIEFEVKTPNWIHPEEKVAVLTLLKHEDTYKPVRSFGFEREPGNEAKKLPTLKDYNHQRYAHYDKPLDNNAGVACEKCGKEMQYVDQNLVTLGNPPSTKVTCECGNSGYKVFVTKVKEIHYL